ncbi:hypothetical protein [Ideonella dechloratans]|uniref:hypothetical protein n=1 Tax=Ideonella dechloratans TaxID=36863 RepID=UPI0035B49312
MKPVNNQEICNRAFAWIFGPVLAGGAILLSGCGNPDGAAGSAASSASPTDVLNGYYLENKSGSVSVSDAFDNTPIYTVQFSNGQMRVLDGSTAMYEGPINKRTDFDKTCIGGEKMLAGMKNGYYLCASVNGFSELGQSYKGQKYQFKIDAGKMFFESIAYDSEMEEFPSNKANREVNGTFHGLVK